VILVKVAAGLVIEFGPGEAGQWDRLSVRLAEGLSAEPFRFEVSARQGRLLVRPLDAREPADLVVALGAILRHEANILAEIRKYGRVEG
jgi:hypothetical protein